MRILLLSFIFLGVFTINPVAAKADEFGDRFYNQAPKGLGDFTAEESEIPDIAMDDMAQDLQDIMPASGEEDMSFKAEVVEEITEKSTEEAAEK